MKHLRIESTFIFTTSAQLKAWAFEQLKAKDLPPPARSFYCQAMEDMEAACTFKDAGSIFSPPRTWIIRDMERLFTGERLLVIQWLVTMEQDVEAVETIIGSNQGLTVSSHSKILQQLLKNGHATYSTETQYGFIHTIASLLELR